MQRLALGLLIVMLCVIIAMALQVAQISKRLDVRDRAEAEMLEARVIVLEKNVERLKAKEEIRDARMPSLQDHPK